ncbi:FIST signal transduction protein [Cryptosporangium sp. NPDC048952]|uniref:FIST signal transduction protein n=1 Tax=Cryptosporangium sp. NPDC048952 TaxID=3363961 RepID=UPI00371204DD
MGEEPARWFSVGYSDAEDAGKAGRDATAAALAGRAPALVIVLSQVRDGLEALVEGVRATVAEHSDSAVIVGTSTSGQYAEGTPGTTSLVVAAYGGQGVEARCRVGEVSTMTGRGAAAAAAECATELTLPHRVLLMFFDSLGEDQQELIRGAYSVTGAATPLIGGSSGDGLTYVRTYQIAGGVARVDVLSGAVVGVGLGCESPLGVGVAHGWRLAGAPMAVTKSVGGRLYELDDRPALDVYAERLGLDADLANDPTAFTDAAAPYPLGLNRRGGEDIRVIHAADPGDRSLQCLADVPQGGLVWQMETDEDALVDAAGESCRQALAMLDGTPPVGLLAFDCAVRKLMLSPAGVERETAAMGVAAATVPYAGWYTNGEVARVRGSQGLHHLTMVTLALT